MKLNTLNRTAALLLALGMTAALAGCNKTEDSEATAESATAESATAESADAAYAYLADFSYSDGFDENGYLKGVTATDYVTLPDDYNDITIDAALADVRAGRTGPIPRQLQNKHFDGADALVKGQNYQYAHNFENHWVDQQYLPDVLKNAKYYKFGDNRTEQAARAYWAKIKGEEKL